MTAKEKSSISLLESKRSQEAWSCIDYVKEECPEGFQREYRSCVLKLPVMILTNGLGQTLAFLKSKGKGKKENSHEKVYSDIETWLFSPESRINWGAVTDKSLMERVIRISSSTYRHITAETLAFLNWLKRFADAALKEEQ